MKIAYITAGAAGMYCGSCMHDNTLVAALAAQGHDALLIPTYTPIRTDEADVSQKRVFFGGINVFLQQKLGLFRHNPWLLDRSLDALHEQYASQCLYLIRQHCREMDGFIATSVYYADFMVDYFRIPRERIQVVYPGLNLVGHGGPHPSKDGRPNAIGYFARICP